MKTIPRIMRPKRAETRWVHGEELWVAPSSPAGIEVTPDSALTLAAAFACINVLATDLACLPAKVYRKRKSGGRDHVTDDARSDLLAVSPDGERTSMRFRQALYGHLFGWGNGFAEITRKGGITPESLFMLSPATTRVVRDNGRLAYEFDGTNGRTRKLAQDVIHIAGLGFDGLTGYSPPKMLRDAFALGKAAEIFGATFFGNGTTASGILKTSKTLTKDARANLRESWNAMHQGPGRAHRIGLLEQGVEFEKLSIDPEDAQFLETRKFQVLEICRIYRVPPHKVAELSQSHLSNIEASNIDYMTTVLMPWCEQIEQELNLKLFTPSERRAGMYVEHSMTAFMRGDTATRGNYYAAGLRDGWLNRDEVRERENLDPIGEDAGGRKYLIQAQMVDLADAGVAFKAAEPPAMNPDPTPPALPTPEPTP